MSATPPRRPLRVLVVEDEPLVAEAHRAFIDRVPGFRVERTVHSGRDALVALGAGGIDLVLLDMGLPDAGGLQVLRAVRSAGVPVDVLAVTAVRDVAVVRAAVSLGVVQYLLKPFSAAALREKLLAYARFRDRVAGQEVAGEGAVLGQAEIDSALAQLRVQPVEGPSKGISAQTLDLVVQALRQLVGEGQPGPSAAEIAARTGLSRESARRYLEHLVAAGRLERLPRYGGAGRPEVGYVPRPSL